MTRTRHEPSFSSLLFSSRSINPCNARCCIDSNEPPRFYHSYISILWVFHCLVIRVQRSMITIRIKRPRPRKEPDDPRISPRDPLGTCFNPNLNHIGS